jgi:hypothetical protein
VLSTNANTSKFDSSTTNHDAAIDIEGAESLVSIRLQATTSVYDTEEDLENVPAQRSRNRDKRMVQTVIEFTNLYLRPKEETE